MTKHAEFIKYVNDYQSFTDQKVDEKNSESLSLSINNGINGCMLQGPLEGIQ